ncbi:class I SAM-dependent methyltransferase [Vallitalea okinawensis]|uniref:class I SAM-dependent methyltransferase n=1 Tax=Vallitalea okinawensis TaxID=2078660 RepID=UPI000CFB0F29|nr:class I SAM-dependent methyltransferase [Vallitalea okinawensis]
MKPVFRQSQLFTFLLYCNGAGLDKTILDCGAGGNCPPLAIFADHDYTTYGIDLSDDQLQLAKAFEEKYSYQLNIQKGDMKQLNFGDESINYAYSYNSIFHMKKDEIKQVIGEIRRVLSKGGYAFINFASVNDERFGVGEEVGEGEFRQPEHGDLVLHSYFEENEADAYFDGFKIIFKENRIRYGYRKNGEQIRLGYIDYIVEKL